MPGEDSSIELVSRYAAFLTQHFLSVLHLSAPSQQAAFGLSPQHAFDFSQHTEPVAQHFCTAAQQPLSSAQHFMPFSQQPSFASATQQALFGWQHASFLAQQSFAPSSAALMPVNNRPRVNNDPANSFVNMEDSPVKFRDHHGAHYERSGWHTGQNRDRENVPWSN
jgi:hypothetical protein